MATKVPGVEIAISDLRESTSSSDEIRVLLIGIRLTGGSVAANTVTRIVGDAQADDAWGIGSQLAQMCRYFRAQAPRVELWAVGVNEAGGGTAATFTLTCGGTATTANPLYIQVEDEVIRVPVAIGDEGDDVAAAIDTAISGGDYDHLHVTSGSNLAVATLTARSKGPHGSEINVRVLETPPGVTCVAAAGVAGATAPDVDGALAVLGGVRYNYLVLPDTDATNLTDAQTFLDGRWEAPSALDGHAMVGKRASVANLATLGAGEDTKHISIIGDPNVPTNPWCQAAAVAAARAARTNPKMSIRNIPLSPIVAPKQSEYLDPDDRETLLQAGIACYWYVQGTPRIDRFPTLAKTNDLGLNSEALYDLETKITVSAIRQERMTLLQPLLGKILVDDASSTEFDLETGREIIDAEGIRLLLIAQYTQEFMPRGWVSDPSGFAASLEVEKTANDTVTYVEVPKINGNLYRIEASIEFERA